MHLNRVYIKKNYGLPNLLFTSLRLNVGQFMFSASTCVGILHKTLSSMAAACALVPQSASRLWPCFFLPWKS